MAKVVLGVVLEALGLPPRRAFERAAEIGAACVQFDASGDLHPDKLSATGRREVRTLLRTCNLNLAGVQVPLRRGLDSPEYQQERIDHLRKVIDLAAELGAKRIVVPCPRLGEDRATREAKAMDETLQAVGLHGSRLGVTVALEVGIDPADAVKEYLALDYNIGIAFDPANFLANGHNPVTSLNVLAERISLMQARDVRRGDLRGGAIEVAVGAGDVDWLSLFASIGTHGNLEGLPVVVDREEGSHRAKDVEAGIKFLRRFVPMGGY